MKKLIILSLTAILSFLLIPAFQVEAATSFYENELPYDTYTIDYEGNLTYTQTAFTPVGVLNRNVALNAPEDIFIKDDLVYVADTGNKRIVVLDYSGDLIHEIGLGILNQPTGLHVSEDDFLYVADKGNEAVYKFALDGVLIKTFVRPVEPLFGSQSLFVPIKVVVGSGENIYIIGDGSTSGVIQLNYDGSFLGYFGVNLSDKSLVERIAEVFVKPGSYASNTPPSPTNIGISTKSLVYTATPNTLNALKMLDVNGINILTTVNYNEESNVVDLSVDSLGYLYAVYADGLIVEYDPAGNLLFAFDIMKDNSNIYGLIQNPSGIAIDQYQNLFLLDKGKNEVFVYQPSSFATLVHQAINLYNQGSYIESTAYFEAILKENDNFALAHSALGKAYYQNDELEAAKNEYFKANDIAGYSEVYWKLRDIWLKDNLGWVFSLILILMAVSIVLKQLNKRTTVFAGLNHQISTFKKQPEVRKFSLIFDVMKHPINSYYEIKREKRSNIYVAFFLLIVLFIEYLLLQRYTGFVFNNFSDRVRIGFEIVKFFGIFGLFVFSNYLVSTLYDGEGWLKDVFTATVYALSPLLVFMVPFIVLSNVLTLNESIIYDIFAYFMITYTGILVFMGIKEIHNYEIKETLKNLLLTLFVMLIIVLILFIIYVFGSQLWTFTESLVKEVFYRVFQ
jgi:tetratricopeptide (TPR) repeat protein